ncbi:hypothetical protein ACTFIU_000066 [Dictyostelium citrinum]
MMKNRLILKSQFPKHLPIKKLIKKEKYVNKNPKYNRDNNCIQDIKVNNEDTSKKLLNFLVFHDVLSHLIYKMKFEQLLELSLVSKTTFSLIRSQLSYNFKYNKFNLGSYVGVRNYILGTIAKEANDPYIYECKLLPFRDMEYMAIEFDYDEHKNDIYNDSHGYIFRQTKKFKKVLGSTCSNLKKVHLLMSICAHFITAQDIDLERKLNQTNPPPSIVDVFKKRRKMGLIRDYTHNGFFTYESLVLNLNMSSIPISDEKEFNDHRLFRQVQQQQLQQLQQQQEQQQSPIGFNFSFNLINRYQPRIIIIRYIPSSSEEQTGPQSARLVLNFSNYENIFNFPSIEIIKLFDMPIPKSFIKKLFTQTNCKIKKLFLTGSDVSDPIISELSTALAKNTTMLKQLCLNTNSPKKSFLFQNGLLQQSLLYHRVASQDEKDGLDRIPDNFFDNLQSTYSNGLTCIDLSNLTFKLNQLLSLKKILSLEKLKYHFRSNFDVNLLNILLEYCRDHNNEIVQLKCIFDDMKSIGDYFKAFLQFFYNYDLPDNYPPWYFTLNIKIIDKSFPRKEYFTDYLDLKYRLLDSSEKKEINVIIK